MGLILNLGFDIIHRINIIQNILYYKQGLFNIAHKSEPMIGALIFANKLRFFTICEDFHCQICVEYKTMLKTLVHVSLLLLK